MGFGLSARFTALMRGFATTYIYPREQVTRLTRAARILVPLTGAAILGAVPVMRRSDLNRAERMHYLLVTSAAVVFLGWLRKWNLLANRSQRAPRGGVLRPNHPDVEVE
jgi:hypothetical protein